MRKTNEAASIQRCWSTWNVLCTYLFTAELIASNPMPMVGRPKLAKTLPKALAADAVAALLTALSADPPPRRRTDWMQRDRALILTALLAGLRADELVRANVGDLRRTDDGAVIHVRGKGGKDRRIPIEPALVDILERYLETRAARFPLLPRRGLTAWPAAAPLFVGADELCARCFVPHALVKRVTAVFPFAPDHSDLVAISARRCLLSALMIFQSFGLSGLLQRGIEHAILRIERLIRGRLSNGTNLVVFVRQLCGDA
jgi:integrase